jgi:hypothetical protein
VLTLPIRGAPFSIEPVKGDQGEAELARSVLLTPDTEGGMVTPAKLLVGQITSAQVYRKAFFETTWKWRENDDGSVSAVYDEIAYRPPATCQARYDAKTGRENGFRQQLWQAGVTGIQRGKLPGYADIPKVRSYIFTHGKHREPITGVSEMDLAYWCYQTKSKLLFLWYYFLENQALSRLVVYGPSQTEANKRADDVAALRGSGVVGMEYPGEGQKAFEEIGSGGDAGAFFQQALSFLENWQISSVLAGFMGLTGAATGGRGSYALSQDQSSFYLKSRQAVADEIAESLSYDVIRPLVLLNFGPGAAYPRWKFGPLQDEQEQALLTLFGQMASAPVLHVPMPVFDLITERMAGILQLDVDAVHKALTSTAAERAEELKAKAPPGMPPDAAAALGTLNGMTGAAVGIAQQVAGQRGGLPPQGRAQQPAARQPPRPPVKPPMIPPPGRQA